MMLERYLQYAEHSEPPTNLHRWSFLACAAACLGRRVYIPFGEGVIYPNMYVLLVGAPGSRKSTAINMCRKLLKQSGYPRFSATKTSKHKFLLDWEEGRSQNAAKDFLEMATESCNKDSEMFVACDELLDFLGPSNFEFLNLFTTLWDNLPAYEERLKNSKSTIIEEPTVNMLGGLTLTGLQQAIPPEAAGTGMLSRVILVYGEHTRRKIAWPRVPSDEEKQEFADFFQALCRVKGAAVVDKATRKLLGDIYVEWQALDDIRLQSYAARRHTHLLKLCLVIMAIRSQKTVLLPEHVIEANTILCYTEGTMSNALGEFGSSKWSEATTRIVQYMENRSAPCSASELYKQVSTCVERPGDFTDILRNLVRAERLIQNAGMLVLKRRTAATGATFTDFETYIPENPTNVHDKLPELELSFEDVSAPAEQKDSAPW